MSHSNRDPNKRVGLERWRQEDQKQVSSLEKEEDPCTRGPPADKGPVDEQTDRWN